MDSDATLPISEVSLEPFVTGVSVIPILHPIGSRRTIAAISLRT